MALNPPIMALPQQEADRGAHIQRFLTSLPRHVASDANLREGGVGESVSDDRIPLREAWPVTEEHSGNSGASAGPEQDLEAERRRYDRKMRRRAKAAIVNPKAEPAPAPMASIESDAQDLPDEWWDDFRRRKRSQPTPADPSVRDDRPEQTTRRQTQPKSGPVRKDEGDRSKRGEGKKLRLKGMDVVMNYKPSIPIPAARLTLPPMSSKGLFGNGRSSDPHLLAHLTGASRSASQTKQASTQPVRQPSSSDSVSGNDWRDQWRANPKPIGDFSHLPPPGNTQSTAWPSQIPSSDPPSRSTRRDIPYAGLGRGRQERYMYRGEGGSVGIGVPPDARRPRSIPAEPVYVYLRSHPDPDRHSHWYPQSQSSQPIPFQSHTFDRKPDRSTPLDRREPVYRGAPQPHHVPDTYDMRYQGAHTGYPPDKTYRPYTNLGNETVPLELESELQDFWKRDAPYPYATARQTESPNSMFEPQLAAYEQHHQPYPGSYDAGSNPLPSIPDAPAFNFPINPISATSPIQHPPPRYAPGPSSFTGSYAYRPSLEPVAEQEVEEYGTTTDEWKHLWSSRKPYR